MLELIRHCIAFIYLLAGSVSDIKTREVADWANYGLIALAIATNLIISIALNDYTIILYSLLGFGVFSLLALIMFYTGQWGGGDSKLLMGMGALYGLGLTWQRNEFLVSFLLNTLVAGAVYGIIWSIVLAIKKRKEFKKAYKKISSNHKTRVIRKIVLIFTALSLIALIFFPDRLVKIFSLSFAVMVFLTFYLWILIKSVEKSCMYKHVTPKELTEGDWIAKDIKHNGKYITGPKDLGITKDKINILKKLYKQNKIKQILIKEGIPFVPSFFLGWLMTIFIGNIMNLII